MHQNHYGSFFFNTALDVEELPITTRVFNPVFVDDYAVPVFTDAGSFFAKTRAVMTCMWNVFRMFHLVLNMEPGKTALLPMVHGPGSAKLHMEISKLDGKALMCPETHGGPISLKVVKAYKYMGVRTVATGDILSEIAARYATARPEFRRLKARLFKNSAVAIAEKTQVASSLLLSRQFNGSGAWTILKTTERQRLHSNVLSMMRGVLGEQHADGDMLNDGDVIHVYKLRAPYAQVRFSRMRLCVRIIRAAPLGLLCLLVGALKDSRSCWQQTKAIFCGSMLVTLL